MPWGDQELFGQIADGGAGIGEEHGVLGDPRHVVAAQQRVARPHDHRHPLGIEVVEAEAGHALLRAESTDHQVQLAAAHQLQQIGIGPGDDAQGDLRGGLLEAGHGAGNDARGHAGQGAEGEHLLALGPRLGDAVEALHQAGQGRGGVVQQGLALRRQHHPGAAALHQPGLGDFLQLLQGLGDGRLGDRQHLGRLLDAAAARDLDEGAQVAKLDPGVEHGCMTVRLSPRSKT